MNDERTGTAWRRGSSAAGRARRSTTGHTDSSVNGDETTRNVRFSDPRLAAMAVDAASAIRWDALRKQQLSSRWSRKKIPHASGSSSSSSSSRGGHGSSISAVYTREDPQSYSVLAKGVLPCGVQELRLVFDTRTSEQFGDVMRTLCQKELLASELVHIVGPHAYSGLKTSDSRSRVPSTYSESSSVAGGAAGSGDARADLVVSAVTFEKANVFARNEEWCFLEYLQECSSATTSSTSTSSSESSATPASKTTWFAKTLLSLHPDDCFFGRVAQRAKHGHDVLAGFHFEEEADGRSTRVTFSGEMFYTGGASEGGKLAKDSASNRVVRARLLKMTQWIDRVALVVRRRRLGIQVLADRRAIKVLNTHCVCCKRSFLMARKKSCALCGYYVCERCSAVEPRETCPDVFERSVIENIRVCDTCSVRVDKCRYAHVTKRTLRPARVVPDHAVSPANSAASSARTTASRSRATTGVVLTHLLQETMLNASEARKKSALSVIKYLVEQEEDGDDARSETSSGSRQQQRHVQRKITLTDESTDAQYFAALQTRLNDKALPVEQCVLANNEKRAYVMEYPAELDAAIVNPVPANEQHRLKLIKDEHLVGHSPTDDSMLESSPELDIICAIASKELGCSGSLITVVDKEAMHVVASTLEAFASKSFPRDQGFCTQTIMSDRPLLVAHPEADVRFANIIPVKHMSVSFYCGFPLLAADKTVIGSVCCVNHESRELTQTQYTVMKRLAETASRVVQMQAKARKRRASAGLGTDNPGSSSIAVL